MFLSDIPLGASVFIDASIFLNVALEEEHAEACRDFLKNVHEKRLSGFVSLAVLDEILFKLIQSEISILFKVPLRET